MSDQTSIFTAGAQLSVLDYAETYKLNGPTESCDEPELTPVLSCGDKVTRHAETSANTSSCLESFIKTCQSQLMIFPPNPGSVPANTSDRTPGIGSKLWYT